MLALSQQLQRGTEQGFQFWIVLFFFVIVGIPIIAGVGGEAYKRKMKFRERELELLGARRQRRGDRRELRVALRLRRLDRLDRRRPADDDR